VPSPKTDHKDVAVAIKRWLHINLHRLTSYPLAWRSWLLRLFGYALLISPPAIFIWARWKELSVAYVVVSLGGVIISAYQKLRPDFESLRIATKTNIEIAAIMRRTYRDFSGSERKEFQRRLLVAIAEQIRVLRNDFAGTRIYANLLIRDSRDASLVTVVARSHDEGGEVRAEHKLDDLAVNRCFILGETVEVGDIWIEFPKTDRTKRYRSILGIPLKSVETDSPTVIGVLSIDSSSPYHFAKWETQLTNLLLPLTTILELTVERPR
jgi:hypothetical protein